MSSVSSWLALYGYSVPIIQPDQGKRLAHIIPVDHVAQSIIRSIPYITYPGSDFILPLADSFNSLIVPKMASATSSNRNSLSSTLIDEDDIESIMTSTSTTMTNTKYFPYIYNISTSTMPITWYQAYTAIQDYWSRPNNAIPSNQKLPDADNYFSANKTLSKARFLMRYYFRSTASTIIPPTPPVINNAVVQHKRDSGSHHNHHLAAPNGNKSEVLQDQQKWMELASNIRNNLAKQNRYPWHYSSTKFKELMADDPENDQLLYGLDWYNYFMECCYGVQVFIMHAGPHLRTSVLPKSKYCALYSVTKTNNNNKSYKSIIDAPFRSVVYTEEEMKQRIQHMIDITASSIRNPYQAIQDEKKWKPEWIEYLNDTLEDWCDESSVESLEIQSKKKREIEQRWKLRVDENCESTRVAVLNDPAVGEAITQVGKRGK